jgi:hypothetical protein
MRLGQCPARIISQIAAAHLWAWRISMARTRSCRLSRGKA